MGAEQSCLQGLAGAPDMICMELHRGVVLRTAILETQHGLSREKRELPSLELNK
jgi:hypothetical protein